MNRNEFIKYIKEINIKWTSEEVEKINYYIKAVKEIEDISLELDNNIGPPYFKKFMFIDDYIKILKDLRNIRLRKFYKNTDEKKKYLRKLELKEDEYKKIYDEYEKDLAKKLNLNIFYDTKNELKIK